MKRYLLLILILTSPAIIFSQTAFRFYQSNVVSVIDVNGKDIKNPFGGGLKFPVFTSMDLNFDGKPDLVVLDRADERILTFLNEGGKDTIKYSYRPEYEDVFPDTLNRYILLKDFNNDGKPDLFTYCNSEGGGTEVYKNISFGNNILFERYFPDPTNPSTPYLISSFYDNTFQTRITVLGSDIPCFLDADKDGDLDFFTFDDMGGSYLWYFKNYSVEANGNADSMKTDMTDSYWGYFMEGDNSNKVFLGYVNPSKRKILTALPGSKRHAGSTVLVNDMEGDGDLDLLVGDVGYPGIRLLVNGKKQTNSMFDSIIAQDTFYPPSKPVNIHNMPGAFNIDINNDGIKDFIFSPMDQDLIANTYIDGLNQIWYYKNTGADNKPVLNFVQNNFLQEDMIDLGGSTSPAFFDFDGDGDLDMFVATKGNNIVTKYLTDRIVLFENTGTRITPVFQKINDDYLNLTAKGFKSLAIHFGDVDADGKKDLIMGNSIGRLIFYKNNSVNDSAVFSYVTDYFDSIDVGDYSVPATADLDHDSKPELIIGSKGKYSCTTLLYYKNISSTGIPNFFLVMDTFGGIVIPNGDHYLAPLVEDMDTNGHPDLILTYNDYNYIVSLGTSNVVIYKDIDLNPGQPFKGNDSLFYNIITGKAVKKFIGRKLKPAVADLDGDSFPDLVFGSERGGLLFYGTNKSLSTKITVTGKTLLCQGDSAILDAGSGFETYTWKSGEHTQQIVVKKAGLYECKVTKGSFSYTAYMSIQVHPGTILADYSYINNNLTVNFTLQLDNIDSVIWSFGDGNYSNDINPTHTYANPGNYTICVEVYDNCGSSDTVCKTKNITGVNEDLNCQISVYPNPAEKMLFIKSNPGISGQRFVLKVTDVLGREVINHEFTMKEDMILDIKTFIPGVYPLIITDLKGKISKKVILIKVGQ